MKKLALVLTLISLFLAGCANEFGALGPGWNPTKPKISLVNGVITPDQMLLVFPRKVSGPVTWTLDDPKFEFADKGIEIEGRLLDKVIRGDQASVALETKQAEVVDCAKSKDGQQFTCNNKHTVPGIYKYTIRIRERANPNAKPIELDPSLVNM